MRPARMPAGWVKVLPWYYTNRTAPSRATDNRRAIEDDTASDESDPDWEE